jgi:DNA-directed RNA polymerase subunit RPC12/RpoP
MSSAVYFVQECPTCGRQLQIRVEYLGRTVVCQHCRGRLTASDPASHRYAATRQASEELLRRADELLRSVDEDLSRSRSYDEIRRLSL